MGAKPRPNEKWWRDRGDQWYRECRRRCRSVPYYMAQEAFLGAYFGLCAPAKVLEFGCGFGRHLQYLSEIAGLDVHGCDQSPTMLANMSNWSTDQWRDRHVKLLEPGQKLPYDDRSVDVVFTVSVLIHIHPDDVLAVLAELLRVARWHVLHVENPPTDVTRVTSTEHDGCWAHPLEKLYEQLGLKLDRIEPFCALQSVYRAPVAPSRAGPDLTHLAQRLCAMDTISTEAGDDARALQSQVGALQKRCDELVAAIEAGDQARAELRGYAESLAAALSRRDEELALVRNRLDALVERTNQMTRSELAFCARAAGALSEGS